MTSKRKKISLNFLVYGLSIAEALSLTEGWGDELEKK